MDQIAKIDKMIALLRDAKKDVARQQKLSAIDYRDRSPKQISKVNADKDWIAMAQIKRRHELHALAVELGFADHRGADGYQEIELTDGWHRYNHKPREPFKEK